MGNLLGYSVPIVSDILIAVNVANITTFEGEIKYTQKGDLFYISSDEISVALKLDVTNNFCVLSKADVKGDNIGYWSMNNLVDCVKDQTYNNLFIKLDDRGMGIREYAASKGINLIACTHDQLQLANNKYTQTKK